MASAVLMPKLGLTMEQGLVVRWRKQEGEKVRKGEVVLEIETDKIASEVESPADGTLLTILVAEGVEAKVQAVLAVVGDPGEDYSGLLASAVAGASSRAASASAGAGRAERGTPEGGVPLPPAARAGPRVSPRARRLLEENGLTVEDLAEMGADRVGETEVQEFLARRRQKGDVAQQESDPGSKPPDGGKP